MMALEPGDHVWYWKDGGDGQISQDKDIPRLQWFPTASATEQTDYLGNGGNIFNFVIYEGEILRGQPHMKHGAGTYAWLNNNPGNITGKPGGPDYGQFPGKFNWHNFLIFPTWDTGYAAIAQLLREPQYASLSILDAFKRYAPGSDSNNPALYAQKVADALGVDTSTTVGDLDENQMVVMQDKITEIEGAVAGDTFAYDAPELPQALTDLLP
jgi:hypothetical protein